MFIRFETEVRDPCSRTNEGIFCAAGDVLFDGPHATLSWQISELLRLRDWFNTHLNCPDRLWYRPGRRGEISGVCWFRDTAGDHVTRARYMAWLLNDVGCGVVERRARRPGRILWEDVHQIVASPHLL
ncbi:hypothetical protein [Roseobacter ponti]|uniref:Uncharacterized protein n=1 Tax=Roseobacter ponti TaxID=1891787 RepID=A0A858SSE6_9RHOB|nr:hypothetical protein [Roseobacter ponti]QJF50838.1 hypothetical protein G3256_06540 [Roseobacter ponti]